jgi:polyhydroxyalkanoate synthesis regulator phasin
MTTRNNLFALAAALTLASPAAFAGAHTAAKAAPATKAAPAAKAATPATATAKMQLTISKIQAERQQMLAENLPLTAEQAPAFWKTYREYSNEAGKLFQKEGQLMLEFINNFDNLSQEEAKSLLDDFLKVETSFLKLKKKYVSRYRKVLSETQTFRYFQIQAKIDDILAYEMGKNIPMVSTK